MRRSRNRLLVAAIVVALLAPLAILAAPEGRLACDEPYLVETSHDSRWTLTICRRPMVFAMPGGGSDAPGWLVLRDSNGAIRGVSGLSMLQLYGGAAPGFDIDWSERRVRKAMVVDLPLDPAGNGLDRWWDDRVWRLRALLGATPSDDELH